MQRAFRVATIGWLLFAACAKEHSDRPVRAPRGAETSPRDAGEVDAPSDGRARRHDSGSREEPNPSAAVGGEPASGAAAVAVLVPTDAHAAESGDAAVRGTAKFRQGGVSVDLMIVIRGCASTTRAYPVFVLEGSDCSEETLRGPHWDGSRGEGVAGVQCLGTAGMGRVTYSRLSAFGEPWTIGGRSTTNLLGHALAIYHPESGEPLACGVIEPDAGDAPVETGPPPPLARAAPIAGLCTAGMFVRNNEHECPDRKELVKCASAHCDLNACVDVCSSYIDCLGEDDPCSRAFDCDITPACSECYGAIQSCSLNFCTDVFACAAPTSPDGPCARLEACCALQGEKAEQCLDIVQAVKKLSGDPSCVGVMQDLDFFSHLEVPCEFE